MGETLIMSSIGVALSVLTIIASFFVAKKYGDVAGVNAAIKYEEEKTGKARSAALKGLSNQVALIRQLAQANMQSDSS